MASSSDDDIYVEGGTESAEKSGSADESNSVVGVADTFDVVQEDQVATETKTSYREAVVRVQEAILKDIESESMQTDHQVIAQSLGIRKADVVEDQRAILSIIQDEQRSKPKVTTSLDQKAKLSEKNVTTEEGPGRRMLPEKYLYILLAASVALLIVVAVVAGYLLGRITS
jgi:hypothetical protein